MLASEQMSCKVSKRRLKKYIFLNAVTAAKLAQPSVLINLNSIETKINTQVGKPCLNNLFNLRLSVPETDTATLQLATGTQTQKNNISVTFDGARKTKR